MAFYGCVVLLIAGTCAMLANSQILRQSGPADYQPQQMQAVSSPSSDQWPGPSGPMTAPSYQPQNMDAPAGSSFAGGAASDWHDYQMVRHRNLMRLWMNSANLDGGRHSPGWQPWWMQQQHTSPFAPSQQMPNTLPDDDKHMEDTSDSTEDDKMPQARSMSFAPNNNNNDDDDDEEARVARFVMMMKRRREIQAAVERMQTNDSDDGDEKEKDDDDEPARRPPPKDDDDDDDEDEDGDDDSKGRRGGGGGRGRRGRGGRGGCGCGGRGRRGHGRHRHHKHGGSHRRHHRRDGGDNDDDDRRRMFSDDRDDFTPYRPWAQNDFSLRRRMFGDFLRRREAMMMSRFGQMERPNWGGRYGMSSEADGQKDDPSNRPQIGPIIVIMQQPAAATTEDAPAQDQQDQNQPQQDAPSTDQQTDDTTTGLPTPSSPPLALHEQRAPHFPQPWERCNITCNYDPMSNQMNRPSFGAGRASTDQPTACMKCQQDCHTRQPVNVTQLFGCVKQTVNDMMPAGKCRNAFSCLTSCIPTPPVRRPPSPADPSLQPQSDVPPAIAPQSWNDCIAKCCDDANGCVDRATGLNLMCSLQQQVRDRVINTCDGCQSQCSNVCDQEQQQQQQQQGVAAFSPPPQVPQTTQQPQQALQAVTDGADANN